MALLRVCVYMRKRYQVCVPEERSRVLASTEVYASLLVPRQLCAQMQRHQCAGTGYTHCRCHAHICIAWAACWLRPALRAPSIVRQRSVPCALTCLSLLLSITAKAVLLLCMLLQASHACVCANQLRLMRRHCTEISSLSSLCHASS